MIFHYLNCIHQQKKKKMQCFYKFSVDHNIRLYSKVWSLQILTTISYEIIIKTKINTFHGAINISESVQKKKSKISHINIY